MTNENWYEALQEYDAELNKLVDECPPELKLAITKWVMKHIVEHAKECGSYRYLIYHRLGFGPEAYGTLLDDGMVISNEFDLERMNKIRNIVKENKIEALKEVLSICDEPDCWNDANCGWPTEDDGYRFTCHKHWKKSDKK